MRHVPPGNYWHPATDNLVGTHVYGTYEANLTSGSAFSVTFKDTSFNEFLFATGDMSVWLRAPRSSVYGTYTNDARAVTCSSGHDGAYDASWTNRGMEYPQDPLIAVLDETLPLVKDEISYGSLLYAENSYSNGISLLGIEFSGVNVFIRFKPGEKKHIGLEISVPFSVCECVNIFLCSARRFVSQSGSASILAVDASVCGFSFGSIALLALFLSLTFSRLHTLSPFSSLYQL